MVTGAYYPELSGGSLQCRSLVLALRDRVHFTIVTTTAVRRATGPSEVDGIPVHRVFVDPLSWRTKLLGAWWMGRLGVRLARECDVFHFHGFTEKMLLLGAVARVYGCPTIEKLTSLGWDDPVSIRRRPLGRLLAFAQKRADRIVAINAAFEERCRQAGVPHRVVVTIPNGVDTARFAPVDRDAVHAIRRRLDLPVDAVLVTFVGFWSREKAPDVLFDAWLQARRETGHAALLFIGSGASNHPEAEPELLAAVRRRVEEQALGDRVFFVERTDDVASYLQASDVFVLPSSREGLSNALLEAMSTGLACVCTRIPGVTDTLLESGSSGWLVPAGDVGALAGVLVHLFRDEGARRDAGTRARQTAMTRFAMVSVADRYFGLYSELVAARPALPSRV